MKQISEMLKARRRYNFVLKENTTLLQTHNFAYAAQYKQTFWWFSEPNL